MSKRGPIHKISDSGGNPDLIELLDEVRARVLDGSVQALAIAYLDEDDEGYVAFAWRDWLVRPFAAALFLVDTLKATLDRDGL